jgi:redox-sensitive bicupin YhaK (pirin superfamily)
MIRLRPAAERGHFDHGWLDTWHTFSFGHYHDPAHMGFRVLRVINDDVVTAGEGFGMHGHRDMEIITWVLDGALEHRDSLGHGSVLRHGDVQRMTAGSGIRHSEFNHSPDEPLRLLQIWILPAQEGLDPGYEEATLPAEGRRGALQLVAAPLGQGGAVCIHQDVRVFVAELAPGQSATLELAAGRHGWVQVARGELSLGDVVMGEGDGAAVSDERSLALTGRGEGAPAEVLVFDLP